LKYFLLTICSVRINQTNQNKSISKKCNKMNVSRNLIKTAFNDAERLLAISMKESAKKLANYTKEQAKFLKICAKEQAMRVRIEFKNIQKEKKNIEKKNKKMDANKTRFNRLKQVGEILMRERPGGFSASILTKKFIEIYGNINVWTGELNDADYNTEAGIRSLLYEMSPSSSQHWFKYGIGRNSNEIAPWTFINKSLAELNNKYEWKATTADTGRGNRKEKGEWIYVPLIIRELWSVENYGPFPTEEMLVNAKLGRKIGVRGAKRVVE
jgi:hypothetical protein